MLRGLACYTPAGQGRPQEDVVRRLGRLEPDGLGKLGKGLIEVSVLL